MAEKINAAGQDVEISEDKVKADQAAADEQGKVQEAVTPDEPAKRSPGEKAAEDAEVKRQEEIVKAVAKAHDKELPKLGGPLREPGLGR
jgi:hypothetical protein